MFGDGLNFFNDKKSNNVSYGIESFLNAEQNLNTTFESSIGDMFKLDKYLYSTATSVKIPFMNNDTLSRVYFEIENDKLTDAQKYAFKKIIDMNGITNNVDISKYANEINKTIKTEYTNSALKKLFTLESVFIDIHGKVHYQASINSPRSEFKNVNFEFNTDNNVSKIDNVVQLSSNMKIEHDVLDFYDLQLHDVIAQECAILNKNMYNNFTIGIEDFSESVKNIWQKIIEFLHSIYKKIKNFIMYFVNWFRGIFSKKYEHVDDIEKIYKTMPKEKKDEWNKKVAEDMKLYLNEEEIVSLTPNELDAVCDFGKQFCITAKKVFEKIQKEMNTSGDADKSETFNKIEKQGNNFIFGDNLYETFKKEGLNFNYTGDSEYLKRIFSMESHELKLEKRKLVDILKEYGLEKKIEGSDILDLYNKTFDYFKQNLNTVTAKTESLLSEIGKINVEVDKLVKFIENKYLGKASFGARLLNTSSFQKRIKAVQLVTGGITSHIGLIQSLIVVTTQNHAIVYNKILSRFRKQFKDLSDVSNTHVVIEDSSAIFAELKNQNSVMTIEGINAYDVDTISIAISRTMKDNKMAEDLVNELRNVASFQPNAFATILPPVQTPIIAITKSLMDIIPQDSVKPILYHEYGHIKNNDMVVGFYKMVNYLNKNKINTLKYVFGGFRTFKQESSADMVAVEYCGAENTIKALQDLLDGVVKYFKKQYGSVVAALVKPMMGEVYRRIGRIKGDMTD